MTTFGETLFEFRQASNDPDGRKRRLSQARLGELIGHEIKDRGVSGATISYWEQGKSKISAEDRKVLVALITVLHKCGGLKTIGDADRLLEAGNYRALNSEEKQKVFGDKFIEIDEQGVSKGETPAWQVSTVWESIFAISSEEFQKMITNAQEGPPPSWPRILAAFMRKISERISVTPKSVLWIWVWLLAWWLIAPSLRWPFADRDTAVSAISMYVVGTLVIPLLIGLLIDTRNNPYWAAKGLANSMPLRLYTYQGAGIGFNLGYFFVLPLVLIRHYLDFGPSIWLEATAVTLGLILGKMAAHVVPHNLWLAYHRLHFADGRIFFVVALLGPLWGIFFLEYYSVLLAPFWGSMIILLAFTLFVAIAVLQSRNKLDPHKQA